MRKWFIFIILLIFNFLFVYGINYANKIMFKNNFMIYLNEKNKPEDISDIEKEVVINEDTKYDGESVEQISKKLERLFKKTGLEGYGEHIANVSLQKNVNPYLTSAIILESTSCRTDCSVLFKQCNNVSMMRGEPGCFGGSYKEYQNVNDGIDDLVNEISQKFYVVDMQKPYKMYQTYGKNPIWAYKVTKYMEELKKGK